MVYWFFFFFCNLSIFWRFINLSKIWLDFWIHCLCCLHHYHNIFDKTFSNLLQEREESLFRNWLTLEKIVVNIPTSPEYSYMWIEKVSYYSPWDEIQIIDKQHLQRESWRVINHSKIFFYYWTYLSCLHHRCNFFSSFL